MQRMTPFSNPVVPHVSDSLRWQAVVQRDHDDSFFYAVLTTGIVCRPGCSSRTPRRDNIRFFPSVADAMEAGFRPCLRCKPHASVSASDKPIVEAMRFLRTHAHRKVALEELAGAVGISASHLQRRFVDVVGVSPRIFAERARSQRFGNSLLAGSSVTEAVYAAGFSSPSRAQDGAARHLGMTAAQMRNRAAGLSLRYAIADCSLGRVLVASTQNGICSIAMGDHDSDLLEDLTTRFSGATIAEDAAGLKHAVQQAVAMVDRGNRFTLPLDLRATAFQMKVWAELQRIPSGETRTYKQVAEALHQPTAVRAVARACATNPVAITVPCHRVIGTDGSLTGYRWGVARKQALLARERG